jgi:tRNA G18 (ribose-2'-O)-methylase SpoU
MPFPALTQIGLQHPRVRQLRAVLHHRSAQHRQLLVAEGLWAHRMLLDLSVPIELFLWCPEAAYSDEAHLRSRQLAARADHAYRISARVLARITERDRPDGLISLVRLPSWDPDLLRLRRPALVLVADAVEIPGNLGTMLRTLDACDADCLVLTNRRTRLTHPRVFRGSRGMNLRVPVVEFDDPHEAVRWLRRRRFDVHLATTGPDATPYHELAFGPRTALVVGNERHGVSAPWREHGFTEVTVPMLGAADSLNVAVTASILLYEVRSRTGFATDQHRPVSPGRSAPDGHGPGGHGPGGHGPGGHGPGGHGPGGHGPEGRSWAASSSTVVTGRSHTKPRHT